MRSLLFVSALAASFAGTAAALDCDCREEVQEQVIRPCFVVSAGYQGKLSSGDLAAFRLTHRERLDNSTERLNALVCKMGAAERRARLRTERIDCIDEALGLLPR